MRLSLKTMTDVDLPVIETWFDDKDTKKRISIDNLKTWFDHVLNNEHYFVSLACLDRTSIGMVMLEIYDNHSAAVAFLIAAQYRGRGYSKQMLQMALDKMVSEDLIVTASVETDNYRSIRCLESSGFKRASSQPDEDNLFHFTWRHLDGLG
ncbi:GNAT family N-acetyltransferase [Alicyclobacillus fastidiosus]|uniref:GNAT family N-acetyltransferase n=1 Tax=Alicyclobacillus fastidiosus TaxID=392011 RepID=A0ABY6ZCN7_9BACL|nr:GNAT family N-acetyltransferase [Alicyclobacillus fastidiosus]WAH40607.1 GNAT family N-acetyltransferase [Alicyclobacillus fastidiosus]GMA62047.1 hypothetical protein GCM10025859_24870 [Alicyclobacillus fastidiosus]